MKRRSFSLLTLLLAFLLLFSSCIGPISDGPEYPDPSWRQGQYSSPAEEQDPAAPSQEEPDDPTEEQDPLPQNDDQPHVATTLYGIGWHTGSEYAVVNDNVPFFEDAEKNTTAFETYAVKDALGRCGVAYANVCEELMPTEERGNISSVKPTGWVQNSYSVIKSGSLYNRSHLIAFQLAGENANSQNLITGTRYMNEAMIPFENMVADYVKETHHHVLYRVTPVFTGNNLLADGVLMEALSVEDDDICFCVFCYNVQPYIYLDYATGENRLASETPEEPTEEPSHEGETPTYVLNTSSKKVHLPTCRYAASLSGSNRAEYYGTAEDFLQDYEGYTPCGTCKPYE